MEIIEKYPNKLGFGNGIGISYNQNITIDFIERYR